jgi:dTDP-4-amino-4,6-dideoxygalactose transaminase
MHAKGHSVPFAFGHNGEVYSFEQESAGCCGTAHALLTSSGTGAMLAAAAELDLKSGDEVIVPADTFI